MATNSDAGTKEKPGDLDWRLLFEKARGFMARHEHAKAADVLRLLALAAPGEPEIWDALGACHDADGRSDIGDALRSLGRLVKGQFGRQAGPS